MSDEEDYFEEDIPFPPTPDKAALGLPENPEEIIVKHKLYIPVTNMLSRDGGLLTAQYTLYCVKNLLEENGKTEQLGYIARTVYLESCSLIPDLRRYPDANTDDRTNDGGWIVKELMSEAIDLDYYNEHHDLPDYIGKALKSGETAYSIAYALISLASYAAMGSGAAIAKALANKPEFKIDSKGKDL